MSVNKADDPRRFENREGTEETDRRQHESQEPPGRTRRKSACTNKPDDPSLQTLEVQTPEFGGGIRKGDEPPSEPDSETAEDAALVRDDPEGRRTSTV